MHIQLGLLCSASKLNFATWAWIGHFFHEQGAEGRRLGRIAEGRAQGSWAGSPCTIPGGTAGQTGDDGVCQGHSSCSSHQLTTPCPPAESSEGGWVASAFPPLLPPKVGPRLWRSFLLPFLRGSPAPCPAACSPRPRSSPGIGRNRGDPPAANPTPVLTFWRKTQLQKTPWCKFL